MPGLVLEGGQSKQTWTSPWGNSGLRAGRQAWMQVHGQAGGHAAVGARCIGCEVRGRSSVGGAIRNGVVEALTLELGFYV